MKTVIFSRAELKILFRESGSAVLPEGFALLPELASALADIVLDHLFGGDYL